MIYASLFSCLGTSTVPKTIKAAALIMDAACSGVMSGIPMQWWGCPSGKNDLISTPLPAISSMFNDVGKGLVHGESGHISSRNCCQLRFEVPVL